MNRHTSINTTARFLWHDSDGAMRMGTGKASDISQHGVFIVADSAPAPGTEVQVIVDMPLLEGGQTTQLLGKGVALRAEPGRQPGFAADLLFQPGWASLLPATDSEFFNSEFPCAQSSTSDLLTSVVDEAGALNLAIVPQTPARGLGAVSPY